MLPLEPEFILFDTEYTTWEGAAERNWSGPGEHKEIVQIGAVLVRADSLCATGHLMFYVLPVINPKLSDFFIRLTGISQETVDTSGCSYSDALARFKGWAGETPLYSWGLDLRVMEGNAKLIDTPFPFMVAPKTDIRSMFQAHGIDATKYHSSTIPRAFGEEPPPNGHDALNDALSILQGLRALKRTLQA